MTKKSSKSLHIFISHEEKEAHITAALKKLIEDAFGDLIVVFVSSDKERIPLGKLWLNTITAALRQADYVFVLCSDTSVKRPWINFELGGAYLLKKKIIPLCIHDMQLSQLPQPYSNFQGLVASDYDRLSCHFKEIADRISYPLPSLDQAFAEYHEAIHNIPTGAVTITAEGAGAYYVRDRLHFSGTVTDGSEIVKLKIYNSSDPYSLLEELKVAVQNDQTYAQEIDSSHYPPGKYYVLAETQKGIDTTFTFLLCSMKT